MSLGNSKSKFRTKYIFESRIFLSYY